MQHFGLSEQIRKLVKRVLPHYWCANYRSRVFVSHHTNLYKLVKCIRMENPITTIQQCMKSIRCKCLNQWIWMGFRLKRLHHHILLHNWGAANKYPLLIKANAVFTAIKWCRYLWRCRRSFVPLDTIGETTLLDVIVQSKLPVVVVTRTTLGTINHTLLTLEALRTRAIEVLGIVFNGDTGSLIEQNNEETILQHHALPFATIPKLQNISEIVEYPITDTSLFERLTRHETSINWITNKRFATCLAPMFTNEGLWAVSTNCY